MESTNTKGNKGLANVIAELINKNYFVFLPFADTTCVDLIVANQNMETKRIQIKYRKIDKFGNIIIPTETVVNGKKIKCDLSKTDIWIIYCPDNNRCYYLGTKDLEDKKSISLRVLEPKQKQINIRYAKDYLDINEKWRVNL